MRIVRKLRKDRKGSVTVMFAGGLSMMVAISALAIDTASFFNDKRRLQGAADAAALAAAAAPDSGRSAADAAIVANGGTASEMNRFTLGTYTPDPALTPTQRFTTGTPASAANAAQVHLERPARTIFARALGFDRFITIDASATAARVDLASFSLGSRLAAVDGGLVNAILSGLTGSNISLSVADYNSLLSGNVDLLGALDVLKTKLDLDVATFEDVLDAHVTLPQLVGALAAATGNSDTSAALLSLAAKLPDRVVPLSAIIDLGPVGTDVHADVHRPIVIDAFSVLRTAIEVSSPTRQVNANVGLNIPGLAQTTLMLQIGDRAQSSPWLSVSRANEVTVRTAQTRLLLDVSLGAPGPLSLGTIHVPLYIELAGASAKLASVSCRNGRDSATASLDVTPSTGQVALGSVDAAQFGNFGQALTIQPARIAAVPLVTVTGRAVTQLATPQAQRVNFNAAQIKNGTVQSVSAGVSTTAVIGTLLGNTQLQVNILGLGLGLTTQLIGAALMPVLSLATGPVDQLLNSVLNLAGVKLGQADSWMNGVRCGTPILVA